MTTTHLRLVASQPASNDPLHVIREELAECSLPADWAPFIAKLLWSDPVLKSLLRLARLSKAKDFKGAIVLGGNGESLNQRSVRYLAERKVLAASGPNKGWGIGPRLPADDIQTTVAATGVVLIADALGMLAQAGAVLLPTTACWDIAVEDSLRARARIAVWLYQFYREEGYLSLMQRKLRLRLQ
ncbi:hypothetical protein WG915_10170 [Corynebacterium sp. H128]|uniref:hypothetical protein n=1 Tax=unclassified Corynebacterium TaxID=2624378 RepID=UPI003098DF1E